MKVYIKTLSMCPMRKVNLFQYKEALKQRGHEIVDSPGEADKVLVWTCAFRKDIHDYSVEVLKGFEDKGYEVVAAGCLPSIDPAFFKYEFKGEILPFNDDDESFNRIFDGTIENAPYPVAEAPIIIPLNQYRNEHLGVKVAYDDQYIKLFIAEGCTRKCSYCTEILAFPPFQSYPIEKIVSKAREMVDTTGVKKLALFGDDIGAYGIGSGYTLIHLIFALLGIDPEVQISLKQINPIWWKKYFNKLKVFIDSERIFQMLVPIQSANTRILDLMERGYSAEDLDFLFDSVKNNLELELETHIIAGFPTESIEEWENTIKFICKHPFRYVMGNIFMPGPGTKAAEMLGQIDEKERERRILTGAVEIEKHGVVIGHSLNWRGKEHLTHTRIDLMEL